MYRQAIDALRRREIDAAFVWGPTRLSQGETIRGVGAVVAL